MCAMRLHPQRRPHLKSDALLRSNFPEVSWPGGELLSSSHGKSWRQGRLKAGVDFHLAFSAERDDPANQQSKMKLIPKVVGGHTIDR